MRERLRERETTLRVTERVRTIFRYAPGVITSHRKRMTDGNGGLETGSVAERIEECAMSLVHLPATAPMPPRTRPFKPTPD